MPTQDGGVGDVGNQAPIINGRGGRVDDDEHAMDIDTELRIQQDIDDEHAMDIINTELRMQQAMANELRACCAEDEACEVDDESDSGSQHESVPGGEAESSDREASSSTTGRGGGSGHVDCEASSASHEDNGNNEPIALPQPPPILPAALTPGTRFRDPPGATWFKRRDEDGAGPQQQMLQQANSAGHAFKAACDYWAPIGKDSTDYKPVKMYASYPDAGAFLNSALLPSDVRFLYELILEGAASKLHLDIEWKGRGGGDGDDAGRRMQGLILLLAKYIEAKLGTVPRFVVLDGSRPAGDGGSKHSYHVICPNVVFVSNTGGMKAFVNDFIKVNEAHQALWFLDDKGNRKCVVDQTIYTKNRCLRTELSCKLSDPTTTTLARVRLDQDGAWHAVAGLAAIDYLDAFVTHLGDPFDRGSIIPDPPGSGSASKKQRKQSLTATKSGSNDNKKLRRADDSEDLSKVVKVLQGMVDAKGGSGCIVVCPLPGTAAGGGGGVAGNGGFQCRNNGDRRCLATPGEFHASNNCYLTVDPEGNVRYSCLAATCKAKGPVKIGVLVEEDDNSNDEVSAAAAAAITSKEAEAAESSCDDSEGFPRRRKQTAAGAATNNDSANRKKAKRLIVEDEGEAMMTSGDGPGAGIPESGGGSSGDRNDDFEAPEAGLGGGSSGGGDGGGDSDGGSDDDDDDDGGGDDDDGSGGGGPGAGGDDLAALEEGGNNELALEAIRELALMTRAAAECAGRGCCSDACFRDLVGAVMEAFCCRPGFAGGMDDLAELTERMEAWRPPGTGSPGSRDALAKLRSFRLRSPVVGLKHDVVQDPQMASDPESLAAASFLRNVDMQRTDPRTLVLVVRLLWPEARGEARAFLERNVPDMGSTLDVVWETGTSFAPDAFTSSLVSHLKLSIQAHPFVRSAIPGLMGHPVLSFDKLDDGLQFSLDDGCVPSERANYVLDYYTGEIVGSKGMGVVRRLFGMKRFFTGDGDAILMAEVLADLGIRCRMRYDTSAGG